MLILRIVEYSQFPPYVDLENTRVFLFLPVFGFKNSRVSLILPNVDFKNSGLSSNTPDANFENSRLFLFQLWPRGLKKGSKEIREASECRAFWELEEQESLQLRGF